MKDILLLLTAIVMACSAKKKMFAGKSFKTFNWRWSLSDDFTVEDDNEAQISFWKYKICGEHFKWVYNTVPLQLDRRGVWSFRHLNAHTFNT